MKQTEKQKEWYLAHREEMREYQRRWYQEHKKDHDKKSREWALAHPEETKSYLEKSYQKRKPRMQQEFLEKYYGENKDEYREVKRTVNKNRKHRLKIKFIKELGGKCKYCGLEYNGENGSVFDFHHLNPEEKEYNPSKLVSCSEDTMRKEIEKCVLVCANCHRILHNSKF